MKKVFAILLAVFLASCVSMLATKAYFNPEDLPDSELATVYMPFSVTLSSIDGTSVPALRSGVLIPAGVHCLSPIYDDSQIRQVAPRYLYAPLEKGKAYLIKFTLERMDIYYDIVEYIDKKEGESVQVDESELPENSPYAAGIFIRTVTGPPKVGFGSRAYDSILTSSDAVITFRGQHDFIYEDKKTGKTVKGKEYFAPSLDAKSGTLSLCEAGSMSYTDFLLGKYPAQADIVLGLVKCTEKQAVLRYEKPESMKGKEAAFTITRTK